MDGCTVGVVHVPGGLLFFKNRDLPGEHLANRVTVYQSTPESHALRGVNLRTKALEGVSIGVITNSFSLLPSRGERSELRERSSDSRMQVASREIGAISGIGALKSLLRSHVPEKGELSICNHREDGGGTESSHIVQIQGAYVGWSALIGRPCESDYRTEQLFQG